MEFVDRPNCPESRVKTAVLAGNASTEMIDALRARGISLILTPPAAALSPNLRFHPDMQLCYCGNGLSAVAPGLYEFYEKTLPSGMTIVRGSRDPSEPYPDDIGYNACAVGDILITSAHTDAAVLECAAGAGRELVCIKQGYAKCSVAVVAAYAAITADSGAAAAMRRHEIDVLEIDPGFFRLEGCSYGFIGGACGKLSPGELAFFGDISLHPQYGLICDFCEKHAVTPVSLCGGVPEDLGSMLPILTD